MKNTFLTFCLLFCLFSAKAVTFSTGESIRISLLTCSPGPIAYEKFGHTAIRVVDEPNNLDIIFNYGLFSFQTDNFYYKFIKGETDYTLGVTTTTHFLPEYAMRNSSVKEQVLNLTKEEKEHLLQALLVNYEPQNREYRYNFVYDNCSTRPRDMIMNSVDGVVIFSKGNSELKTFRTYIEEYAGWNTWLMFGIDIVFGATADGYATKMASMFLPEVLEMEFREAKIISPGKKGERNLISKEIVLVDGDDTVEDANKYMTILFSPIIICALLLLIGMLLMFFDFKRKHRSKLFYSILFIVTGLAGVIIFYLSFISIHPLVRNNYNLLWLNPLNIVAGIILWFRSLRPILSYYLCANLIALITFLFLLLFNIQYVNVAFISLIALLLFSSLHWISYRKGGSILMRLTNSKKQSGNRSRKRR